MRQRGSSKEMRGMATQGNRTSVTDYARRMLLFLFFYLLTFISSPLPPPYTPAALSLFLSFYPLPLFTLLCVGGQLCSSSHFELYRSVGDCVCCYFMDGVCSDLFTPSKRYICTRQICPVLMYQYPTPPK